MREGVIMQAYCAVVKCKQRCTHGGPAAHESFAAQQVSEMEAAMPCAKRGLQLVLESAFSPKHVLTEDLLRLNSFTRCLYSSSISSRLVANSTLQAAAAAAAMR
jgi:hypothetical protein